MSKKNKKTKEEFESFDVYLDKIGAERLEIKNMWEDARFIANEIICVVYHNKQGTHSYSNELAKKVHLSFLDNKLLNIQNIKRKKLSYQLKEKLFKRDGNKCFYTGIELSMEIASIEHLIPLSKGGKNNIDNLVLCTDESNKLMADKPLTEKIIYRENNIFK